MMKGIACIATIAGLASGAMAQTGAYGLLFQVSTDGGATWSQNANIDVSGGAQTVMFTISSYFDPAVQVTTADGTGGAVALARFTGSNIITNFGRAADGDLLQSYVRDTTSGNALFSQSSQNGANRILGVANNGSSFASQLLLSYPGSPIFVQQIAHGTLVIGNGQLTSFVRTISLTNNTFGTGTIAGLTFYNDASPSKKQSAAPSFGSLAILGASINVVPSPAGGTLFALVGLAAARRRRA
jgi:hypothetical protein